MTKSLSYLCVRGRSARAAEDVDVIAALNSAVSVRPAVALSTRHGAISRERGGGGDPGGRSERGCAWRSESTWSQEAKTASGRPQLSYSPALTAGRTARRSRRIVSASAPWLCEECAESVQNLHAKCTPQSGAGGKRRKTAIGGGLMRDSVHRVRYSPTQINSTPGTLRLKPAPTPTRCAAYRSYRYSLPAGARSSRTWRGVRTRTRFGLASRRCS